MLLKLEMKISHINAGSHEDEGTKEEIESKKNEGEDPEKEHNGQAKEAQEEKEDLGTKSLERKMKKG